MSLQSSCIVDRKLRYLSREQKPNCDTMLHIVCRMLLNECAEKHFIIHFHPLRLQRHHLHPWNIVKHFSSSSLSHTHTKYISKSSGENDSRWNLQSRQNWLDNFCRKSNWRKRMSNCELQAVHSVRTHDALFELNYSRPRSCTWKTVRSKYLLVVCGNVSSCIRSKWKVNRQKSC